MPSMRIVHYNGTAPAAPSPAKVLMTVGLAQRINIRNVDGANSLEVSFDSGRNFYLIPINSLPLDIPCSLHFFYVRGVGGTAAYTAVTNEG